jgi:hypothetical protein
MQPLSGASEVKFLGDSQKAAQLTQLHRWCDAMMFCLWPVVSSPSAVPAQ